MADFRGSLLRKIEDAEVGEVYSQISFQVNEVALYWSVCEVVAGDEGVQVYIHLCTS